MLRLPVTGTKRPLPSRRPVQAKDRKEPTREQRRQTAGLRCRADRRSRRSTATMPAAVSIVALDEQVASQFLSSAPLLVAPSIATNEEQLLDEMSVNDPKRTCVIRWN